MTLVRQFRAGAYLCDGTLATIEACAGMLDGDSPRACVVREALEETGICDRRARPCVRRLHESRRHDREDRLLRRPYSAASGLGQGGGVDDDEDIEVVEIAFAEALAMIGRGEIADAKTIALLYFAAATGLMK